MEFQLISPQNIVETIQFNYEDLHNWVTEQTEKYNNLVYTDETIKEAKEDRAKLNKFRENLDNARKDVKKRWLEPYNVFETDMKKLLAIVDKPLNAIDTQVKKYEEKKKNEKRVLIQEYFDMYAGDLSKFLTLDKIFNEKWLNATTSIKSIKAEIDTIFQKTNSDIQTIKDLHSEWELTLLDTYINTLDIGAALREKTRLEERKKDLEEVEQTVQVNNQVKVESEPVSVQVTDQVDQNETIYLRKFWVKGYKWQLKALGQYLKDNNIEYGGLQ